MLNVHLIQANIRWRDPEANLAEMDRRLNALNLPPPSEDADRPQHLVLMPEMFTTGFSMDTEGVACQWKHSDRVLMWMKDRAGSGGFYLAGSLMMKHQRRMFNMFVLLTPTGDVHTYEKRHLFGLAGENKTYYPGKRRLVWEIGGYRVFPMVCYDLRFPVWSRNNLNYDVLVYVANWPAARIEAWNILLKARAVENQSYVVAVNRVGVDGTGTLYSGQSQVIDPLGTIVAHAGDEDTVLSAVLERGIIQDVRSRLPFLKDGDSFQMFGGKYASRQAALGDD
jgi:predicted amidohydrolase